MEDRLEKLKDSLNYTIHTYSRHITGEDYHEITTSDLKWLIERAERLEKIKKLSNAEEITLTDFSKEVLQIIEDRETPTRNIRS